MGRKRVPFAVLAVVAALVCSASPGRAGVMLFSRTFEPADLPINRYHDVSTNQVYDDTRASIHGATSAGGGDEIHINLVMHNSALRFEPTGTLYFIEAYLFNNGGVVNPVGVAQLNYAGGSNVNNLTGTLDYEASNIPSWRGSQWATRAEFLTNPAAPGQFSQLDVSFTIPAGYPVSTFDEVYMNIGVFRQLSFGQQPGPMMMSTILIPEPGALAVLFVAAGAICTRRRRGSAGNRPMIPVSQQAAWNFSESSSTCCSAGSIPPSGGTI